LSSVLEKFEEISKRGTSVEADMATQASAKADDELELFMREHQAELEEINRLNKENDLYSNTGQLLKKQIKGFLPKKILDMLAEIREPKE
jgi:chaperonin cofactor prefoldin